LKQFYQASVYIPHAGLPEGIPHPEQGAALGSNQAVSLSKLAFSNKST